MTARSIPFEPRKRIALVAHDNKKRELLEAARYNDDPTRILRYGELVNKVTSRSLRAAARAYLDPHRVLSGAFCPESWPKPPKSTAVPAPTPAPT